MKSKRMEQDEFSKWWLGLLLLIIVTIIVLTVTGAFVKKLDVMFERQAFEESYQYTQSVEDEINTYSAQLAELEAYLVNPDLSNAEQSNIQGQINAINIRLRAAQSRLND